MAQFIVRLVIALCRKFRVADEVMTTLIGEKRAAPFGYCDTCGKPLDENSSLHGIPCPHCGYAPATMKRVVRYEMFENPETGRGDMVPVFAKEDAQEVAPAAAVTNGEDLLALTVDRAAIIDALAYLKGSSEGWPMGEIDGTPLGRLYEAMKKALA